jgi:hypothetical protein
MYFFSLTLNLSLPHKRKMCSSNAKWNITLFLCKVILFHICSYFTSVITKLKYVPPYFYRELDPLPNNRPKRPLPACDLCLSLSLVLSLAGISGRVLLVLHKEERFMSYISCKCAHVSFLHPYIYRPVYININMYILKLSIHNIINVQNKYNK